MKKRLTIILLLSAICSVGQKVQTVTIKPTTGTVNLKVTKGQKVVVQINGKKYDANPVEAPTVTRKLYLKDFSDYHHAINEAIVQNVALEGDTLTLSNDCIPEQHVPIDGDLTIQGTEAKPLVITCNFRDGIDQDAYGLYLGGGKKTFNNVVFVKGGKNPFGSCIQTTQADINYNITFNNCKWIGNWKYNLQSTMGHGTVTFNGCSLFAIDNNIQYYSQIGSKTLVMRNCDMQSITTHNVYSHLWNNHDFYNVVSKGCGKGRNALNIYATKTDVPYFSTMNRFVRCRNAPGATAGGEHAPMWRIQANGGTIEMDSCDLPTFEWNGVFNIRNTNITNEGNGTAIYGASTLTNCTGKVTAISSLYLIGCNMTEVIVPKGSNLTMNGGKSAFNYVYGSAQFNRVDIGDVDIYEGSNSLFDNCNFNSQYKRIRGIGAVKFVGNSYPVN